MNYSKKTDHLDIHIDESAKTITIRQRWKYEWRYDSLNGITNWTAAEKQDFHKKVLSLITSIWQGAPRIHLKGDSDFVKRNAYNSFKFRFDIQQVDSNEHWTVLANKISSTARLTSTVNWSTRRIVLDTNDTVPTRKTNGLAIELQIPVAHEFGHTIGNIPYLYQGSHGDEYNSNLTFDLGAGIAQSITNFKDSQSIMNIGSFIRQRHFDYLLRELI